MSSEKSIKTENVRKTSEKLEHKELEENIFI